MGIRPKLIIVFLLLGFLPVMTLIVWQQSRRVDVFDAELRKALLRVESGIAQDIESSLRAREGALVSLARSPAISEYVVSRLNEQRATIGAQAAGDNQVNPALPAGVQESVRTFLLSCPNCYTSVSLFNSASQALFRAEPFSQDQRPDVRFQTKDFLSSSISPDSRVWGTPEKMLLRSAVSATASGAVVRYSIPVFAVEAGRDAPRHALVFEVDGNTLFDEVMTGRIGSPTPSNDPEPSTQNFIIVLDHEGHILFHPNEALRHQSVNTVLPAFKSVSDAMLARESGMKYYDTDGSRWLVAYQHVTSLDASFGVAQNYTQAIASIKRSGWITLLLAGLFGLVTVIVLARLLRNTSRSIERVTEGAVAIAGGKLDQRIEVRSSDETHLLAESFNIMTDRLTERIARETETRQFESFVRISAMLTHDLKNAIAGLSLLVGNMKKQFHREEFRADAMESLTDATNKLRRLVTKLSQPVESLSGEHTLSQSIDLIPMMRRVIVAAVEPASALHEVDVRLPDKLNATVDVDRIERVFENLIINALEAMGSNAGRLTVEGGEMPGGEIFFSVSDTGPGMSEEFQRTKLFHPFATTKKTGVGLGLYTCNEVVVAHGGHIEVESKRGSGATFRVVLPSEPKITPINN